MVDYSADYPQRTGKVLCRVSYEELKSGEIQVQGRKVEVGSMSSYSKALEIAAILRDEIKRGEFLLSEPLAPLPREQAMRPLEIQENNR